MTSNALSRINFRQPTGKVAYPCILVAGEEGVGKTWKAFELSKSPKVGKAFAIDLGEGSADEYAPIGDYVVVTPKDPFGGWSFAELFEQVCAIHYFAAEQRAAGEPPVLLVVDTMSDEDAMLKEGMNTRAKSSEANKRKLARDPMAELDVPFHIRNETNAKHRRLMTKLLTFPGIVVLTARAKEVAEFKDGQPVRGADPIWKPEGHRTLLSDCSAVIRMDRGKPAELIKARSLHCGVQFGMDAARPLPEGWTLEWFVFEALKLDPATAQVRDLNDLSDSDDTPADLGGAEVAQHLADQAATATTTGALASIQAQAAAKGLLAVQVRRGQNSGALGALLTHLHTALVAREDQQAAAGQPAPPAPVAPAAPAPVATPEPPAVPPVLERPAPAAALEPIPNPQVEVQGSVAEPPAQAEAPAPVAQVVVPTFTPEPEGETRPARSRRYGIDELRYQAQALSLDLDSYAAELGDLEKVQMGKLSRFIVPNREGVIESLRGAGRTVEASAYEAVGIGFPVNLAVHLGFATEA